MMYTHSRSPLTRTGTILLLGLIGLTGFLWCEVKSLRSEIQSVKTSPKEDHLTASQGRELLGYIAKQNDLIKELKNQQLKPLLPDVRRGE